MCRFQVGSWPQQDLLAFVILRTLEHAFHVVLNVEYHWYSKRHAGVGCQHGEDLGVSASGGPSSPRVPKHGWCLLPASA